jgi:hypothetical protein
MASAPTFGKPWKLRKKIPGVPTGRKTGAGGKKPGDFEKTIMIFGDRPIRWPPKSSYAL